MTGNNGRMFLAQNKAVIDKTNDRFFIRLRDGREYWLSLWDRVLLMQGWTDVSKLERKYWDRV
jgi:hypothetical protein